ncbi:MAG: hypothetical protein QXF15_02515 [Candidatus Aenigmatarchaeota archaeon]
MKEINHHKRGILFFSILMVIGLAALVYDIQNFQPALYNTLSIYTFFIILFGSIILFAFIHELNHWLSAKTFGYRNRQLGISPILFFVNPVKKLNKDNIANFFVTISGALFTISEISIASMILLLWFSTIPKFYFFGTVFTIPPFAFPLIESLYVMFIIGISLNAINLFPLFSGVDGFEALKILIKKNKTKTQMFKLEKKLSIIFSSIFIIGLLICVLMFTPKNISIYSLIFLIISFITSIIMVIYFNMERGRNMFNSLSKKLEKKKEKDIIIYKKFMVIFDLRK